MSLIDLPTAKLHLRVDVDDEDALIGLYIGAAETAACDFLNRNVYGTQADLDAADEPEEAMPMVINPAVRAAILLILGHLYANREDVVSTAANKLPMGAHSLLYPHRVGLGV